MQNMSDHVQKHTKNMVEQNFKMFIKYFLIFYTSLYSGQTQRKFSIGKQLIVLHNKKNTGNTFYVIRHTLLTQK
jgi:hypothetical protein